MSISNRVEYTRQEGILDPKLLRNSNVTIIGNGSVGSFTVLTLGKMGVRRLRMFDDDGVTAVNLSNQFFRKQDVGQFKVDALANILSEFTDSQPRPVNRKFRSQALGPVVIVATDSMSSRKLVWERFKKDPRAKVLIEARMGAELGMVYTIRKNHRNVVPPDSVKFYEGRLYTDEQAKELPCTARTIIYNVLMLSSLICRAYKGYLTSEKFPRELIFNMTRFDERSFMMRA